MITLGLDDEIENQQTFVDEVKRMCFNILGTQQVVLIERITVFLLVMLEETHLLKIFNLDPN